MIANALVVTFVISFIAIVVFGHILLLGATWSDRLGKRDEPKPDPAEPVRHVPLPN